MSFSRALIVILMLLAPGYALAQGQVRTTIKKPTPPAIQKSPSYTPPRPAFAGLRLMMPADSARMIMKKIALRQTTHQIDSMTMIESDSIRL